MKAYQRGLGWVAGVVLGILGTIPAHAQLDPNLEIFVPRGRALPQAQLDRELSGIFAGDRTYLTLDRMVIEVDGQEAAVLSASAFRDILPRQDRQPRGRGGWGNDNPGPIIDDDDKPSRGGRRGGPGLPRDEDPIDEEPIDDGYGDGGVIGLPGGAKVDAIVNLGRRLWKFIEKNQPVVNVKRDVASAVPAGIQHWSELAGWQTPRSKVFRLRWKNGYGIDVVDFSFRVLYTYGGSYGGTGRYLRNVTAVPDKLKVLWGFRFDSSVSIPEVVNVGTAEDPIGAAEMLVDWSVKTLIKHDQSSMSFFIRGDGKFEDLTKGN